MFDTMTMTKVAGALCGSLLVFLLGAWAAEELYHTGGGHGHGGEAKQGYAIEVETASAGAAVEEGPSLEELLAAADLGKGEKVFGKCKACHKLEDGANGTGPHLFNVVDRAVGVQDGFAYSGAMVAVAETWSAENLDGFLASPKKFAPGTKMGFGGLKKPADRANLIAYLATIK
ncbi:c-type cytochrome [Cognatishimia activa]|uniref:Cytochrome c552 n=1 Tax=Cognatishimia activa TaxID=1715691 RepID=A0A0P1IR24_9RHOB|nr:cytochrome c family protein [Cognatishimia activa]MEE2944472.1 cytochrome c family protein [Pseudomonadota bacterium]CUJ06128.1 Cytochrome c552 [Cognatishimia activa]CUK26018.1 Cytochrome c552 [Cognatishimia activa]